MATNLFKSFSQNYAYYLLSTVLILASQHTIIENSLIENSLFNQINSTQVVQFIPRNVQKWGIKCNWVRIIFNLNSWSDSTLNSVSTYSLKARVVGVPRDDRYPEVAGELEEILRGRRTSAVLFVIHQVQNGGHVDTKELFAKGIEDIWNKEMEDRQSQDTHTSSTNHVVMHDTIMLGLFNNVRGYTALNLIWFVFP